MHRLTLPTVLFAAAVTAGCFGRVGYRASASTDVYGPDLVYAAPGVQVIADYEEPIFYADNVYWRHDGRTWYRSSSYTGGWAYATPPRVILGIQQPTAYAHYRPQGWTPRGRHHNQDGRDHRQARPRGYDRRR